MWWKQHKWKVLVPVLVIAVLAAAFWYGGDAPGLQGWTADGPGQSEAQEPAAGGPAAAAAGPEEAGAITDGEDLEAGPEHPAEDPADSVQTPESGPAEAPPALPEESAGQQRPDGNLSAAEKEALAQAMAGGEPVQEGDEAYSQSQGMVIDPETGKDQYLTDPVPEGRPLPVEPQDAEISDEAHTCTLSISCASILNHMDWLAAEKAELVPEDGWILEPLEVTFYEGESVFNVLQRTCKQEKIHMEFSNTPMYNSAYIEGIHNLYQFDCGELSGWMYKVNDWFPNYGCSRYALQDGDVICWEYTCDLGVDVGGRNAIG